MRDTLARQHSNFLGKQKHVYAKTSHIDPDDAK